MKTRSELSWCRGAAIVAVAGAAVLGLLHRKRRTKKNNDGVNKLTKMDRLCAFEMSRILNVTESLVATVGKFPGSESDAVIIMKNGTMSDQCKSVQRVQRIFSELNLKIRKTNSNYAYFEADHTSSVSVEVVWPADEKVVKKWTRGISEVFVESREDYEREIVPTLPAHAKRLDWLYAILDGKNEQEDIIAMCTAPCEGFVLLPNPRWKDGNPQNLLCLAIVRDRSLRTLRDLRKCHVPLLRHIKDVCTKSLVSKHGVKSSDLLFYIHYLPQFYHLHVHICHRLRNHTRSADRAHLVEAITHNLGLAGDYYINAPLVRMKVYVPDAARGDK